MVESEHVAQPPWKGVGETGTIAATAAVINAVADALAPRGITDIEMPATPEKV
jgi:aerobic carbon-monoxide dehydrogenase large subunit